LTKLLSSLLVPRAAGMVLKEKLENTVKLDVHLEIWKTYLESY
jgi:hypothetical protein